MSARLGPSQRNLLGVAARLHRQPDVLLNLELHLVPCGISRRDQLRVRERVEVGLDLGVRAHPVQAGLGDREEAFGGDPPGDGFGLVVQLEKLRDGLLIPGLLEGHEIVLDGQGHGSACVRRHLGDAVVDLALGVELLAQRTEAHHHADLAVLEELEGAVSPVGLPWVHLGHLVLVGEVREELQRLEVLVAVDHPPIAGLPVAAVVPHPDRPLGLGLLGAQGQRVADRPLAESLDSLGGPDELVPGFRGRPDAGPGEQILVVEEGPRAREDREAIELALVLAAPGERRQEIVLGFERHDLVGRMKQPVLRVAGKGVQIQHVRRLVVLDHRGDLLVDRVPINDLQVDLDAGLLRVRLG